MGAPKKPFTAEQQTIANLGVDQCYRCPESRPLRWWMYRKREAIGHTFSILSIDGFMVVVRIK
jgi:hypothetical protein